MINSSQKKMKKHKHNNYRKKKQRKPENNINRGVETFKNKKEESLRINNYTRKGIVGKNERRKQIQKYINTAYSVIKRRMIKKSQRCGDTSARTNIRKP